MKEPCSKFSIAIRILLVMACLAAMSVPMWGQGFYGSIVGTVTDASGAIIPGAAVTLTNIGTNEKRTAETDATGNYRFVSLVPANYRLEVEMTGFKRLTREPINVQVEATVRIDAALEVGTVTETVEVSSRAPLLQTETATLSQVVEGQQVQEMPLNGRNVMNLIALTPGVIQQGGSSGAVGLNKGTSTGSGGWGNIQIGGGAAGQSAFYIDGAPNNTQSNLIALMPTQDAIQEFRVASNAASVEYGRFAGGVVTMTTKSGTNTFHGSAYEYLRNPVLNANQFFSNLQGAKRPNWIQNQYGATISGPVVKDKLFFFFSYEGFKARLGAPTYASVPTQDMRNGTFNKAVSMPASTPSTCYTWYDANGTVVTTYNATIIKRTQINPSCFDPSAKYMMGYYYPLPTLSGSTNNYFASPAIANNANQYNARIDYNISDKQRLFGRYTYWLTTDPGVSLFGNNVNVTDNSNGAKQYVLGDTYTFNATTILDMRVSVMRSYRDSKPASMGTDMSQFGPNYARLAPQMTYNMNPALTFSGGSVTNVGAGALYAWPNIYDIAGNLTKIKGNHSLRFGGTFRLQDYNVRSNLNNPSGGFTFNTSLVGDEFAAFLLGLPSTGEIRTATPVGVYTYYQGYYAADSWQVNRKLTLNLGVRWELAGAEAERHDRSVVLFPNTMDPVTGVRGTLPLVSSSLYPERTTQEVKYHLFAPRVGFAYRLTDNAVLRAGYGISYLPNDVDQSLAPYSTPIVSNSTSWTNSLVSGIVTGSTGTVYTLSNPFASVNQPAGRNDPNYMQKLLGQTFTAAYPYSPYPYVQQWNLSFGYQFAGDVMVEIGYAGAKGTQLPTSGMTGQFGKININQLPSQYYYLGATLLTKPSGSTMTVGQSLRPFPAYNNVYNGAAFGAISSYHSAQVKLEKRFRSGGVLMANYTWAKNLGTAEGQNPSLDANFGGTQDFNNMLAGDYSLSSFDVPHRLIASYVLDLPFGKGKKFANYGGVAGVLVSGWAVNGIVTFQSGYPIALSAKNNNLTTYFGAGTIRPNYVANCVKEFGGKAQDRLNKWFNTACFTAPGSYSFGNEGRTDPQLRSQGVNNWDFSILKTTKIKESLNLQFRAEAFNLFNRVRFNPPAVVVDGTNFGAVTAQQNQPRLIQFSLRLNF
jgi:hypothetical protein